MSAQECALCFAGSTNTADGESCRSQDEGSFVATAWPDDSTSSAECAQDPAGGAGCPLRIIYEGQASDCDEFKIELAYSDAGPIFPERLADVTFGGIARKAWPDYVG